MNLVEGLQAEMKRCRKLVPLYEGLPNNAGFFGVTIIKQDIANAEESIASGDTVKMMRCYKALKVCEG